MVVKKVVSGCILKFFSTLKDISAVIRYTPSVNLSYGENFMEIRFLGSGDAFNSGGRNHSSVYCQTQESSFLLDCGPTTLQAAKKAGIVLQNLNFILITHLHGDHFGGLPFLLIDFHYSSALLESPLVILGPPGLAERVDAAMEILFPGHGIEFLRFKPIFKTVQSGDVFKENSFEIKSFAMIHQKEDLCLGYKIQHKDKILACSGDTGWCENVVELAQNCGLFHL